MENLFKKAEEYIWMIHDQYPLNILPLGVEALKRGVNIRSIDSMIKEENKRLDTERPSYIKAEDEEYFLESWKEGSLEIKFLEAIQVLLYVTEKEAIIAFPLVDGSFDYTGFATFQPAGLRLCQDIFEYYWSLGIYPTQERIRKSHNFRMKYHRDSEK
jgi:predicted transcriptional regulator